MPFDSNNFQIVKTISYEVDRNLTNQTQIILDSGINNNFPDYDVLSINTFIKNLKLYASVPSLQEATLPEFNLEDSATERLYKALDAEWKEPRYQLDLFISGNDIWTQVGAISIVNIGGYPYRTYNLQDIYTDALAIELGSDGKIGVALKDVGYGYPGIDDKINVFGSYLKEVVHKVETTTTVTVNVSGGGGSVEPPEPILSGSLICTGQCSTGGKAYQSSANQTVNLNIVPSPNLPIVSGSNSIQIHRWNQLPNTSLAGRIFLSALPATGGTVPITLDGGYQYFSIFAKNPNKGNFYDGCCFTVSENTINLVGYN